jgi:hypothetical protein
MMHVRSVRNMMNTCVVIYPGTNAPLRTDISFDEMADEYHHRSGSCPLKPLSVEYVTIRFILYARGLFGNLQSSISLLERVIYCSHG